MISASVLSPLAKGIFELLGGWFQGKKQIKLDQIGLERLAIEIEGKLASGQLDIAKIQAQHRSVWVAGARPAIMWVCAAGFGYALLGQPIWVGIVTGMPPEINEGLLMPTMLGILGLGGMRSYEKKNGLTK